MATPSRRDAPAFEVYDETEKPLFDISVSDDGFSEIAFHPAIAHKVLPLDDFLTWLDKAHKDARLVEE